MSNHDHPGNVEGCYRCELAAEEAERESLRCPFRKGQVLTVPRGTRIWKRGNWSVSARRQTVTISQTFNGYRDKYGSGAVAPPKVSWAGSGGYWVDAVVDDRMRSENEMPE